MQYEPAEMDFPDVPEEPSAEHIQEENEETKKFKAAVVASQQILFRARNIFPFDFFPDEIVIDENKIDVIHRIFFETQRVFTIPYSNINGATSTVGIFFGSLSIELTGFEENPPVLTYLKKSDAIKARRIINGLVTAHKQGVQLQKVDLLKYRDELESIGEAIRG